MTSLIATAQTAQQAEDAYQQGDYAGAAMLYEQMIAQGAYNANLYVNLAHAHLQQDNLGHALLYYRRAAEFLARDTEIQQQVARVRSRRIQSPTEETNPLAIFANSTASTVTLQELGWIALLLWSALCMLLILYRTIRRGRDVQQLFLAVYLVFFLLTLSLFLSRLYMTTQQPEAVVLAESVQVYSGPGEDFLKLYELFNAAEVRIIAQEANWLRIEQRNGQQGWIAQESVGLITSNLG